MMSNTIWGVPYYNYSTIYTQNPILSIEAPLKVLWLMPLSAGLLLVRGAWPNTKI